MPAALAALGIGGEAGGAAAGAGAGAGAAGALGSAAGAGAAGAGLGGAASGLSGLLFGGGGATPGAVAAAAPAYTAAAPMTPAFATFGQLATPNVAPAPGLVSMLGQGLGGLGHFAQGYYQGGLGQPAEQSGAYQAGQTVGRAAQALNRGGGGSRPVDSAFGPQVLQQQLEIRLRRLQALGVL